MFGLGRRKASPQTFHNITMGYQIAIEEVKPLAEDARVAGLSDEAERLERYVVLFRRRETEVSDASRNLQDLADELEPIMTDIGGIEAALNIGADYAAYGCAFAAAHLRTAAAIARGEKLA